MVTKVVMPKLSLTMKEGTVGKWYKGEGDTVEKGEAIVEIISEKATYDLESPASGVLRKIMVEEGLDAPVNAVLAVITEPEETEIPLEETLEVQRPAERVLASPAAKRLARESGLDLSSVKGSGSEGRIAEEDVKRHIAEAAGFLPKVKEIISLSGFRKTTAERVSTSFKTAPHSTVVMQVDASKAKELHEKLGVSYTTVIVKAVAKALLEHPMINSTLQGEQIRVFENANVGIAIATEHGLVVPVVHGADRLSLKEIDRSINDLTEKARNGKLTKEELAGGTFTISNLGMYEVEFFTPIINPPEAAILGIGKITENPVIIDGKVEAKPTMMFSLSYDHRIVDGVPAAQFLLKVKERIEKGLELEY